MLVDTANLISVSEATRRGVSKLAAEAAEGHHLVLLRNSKPIAAVVGMDRLAELDGLEALRDDLDLIALTLARVATDNGNRTSHEDVLARFGLTADDLELDADDDEADAG